MIVDHVWRPPHAGVRTAKVAREDRPCAYLNCGQPIEEHAYAREATHVAWEDYRKCTEVCQAEAGEPCRTQSGYGVMRDGTPYYPVVAADAPHSSRKLRTPRQNGAR